MAFFLYHLVCISLVRIYYVEAFDRSSIEREINFINSVQSSWKAGYNRMSEVDPEAWKKLLGLKFNPKKPSEAKTLSKHKSYSDTDFPKNFDPREAWPACKDLISFIRNQGNCGSCWAVAAASAFSDSLCIASNGTFNVPLSTEDILTCCKNCTDDGDGCEGGYSEEAMIHLREEGIVTGGEEFSSNQAELGCLPYSNSSYGGKCGQCQRKCSNGKYEIQYSKDKHYIKQFYKLKDENEIKKQLMSKGSCYVGFDVHADFDYYKTGVYSPTTSEIVGGHAVRLLGWGVAQEEGLEREYWLVANSWGASWGENGTIRMERKSGRFFGDEIYCVEPLMDA